MRKTKLNHTDVEALFKTCFYEPYNTLLVGGAEEPLYEPSNSDHAANIIYYRNDYISSAFHEIAHWCIAGKSRRALVDYGYWYAPDGRNREIQNKFEQVEVKPQALEYAFSLSANIAFRVSIDNLAAQMSDEERMRQEIHFTQGVSQQLAHYITHGFNARAHSFIRLLQQTCHTQGILKELL